MASAPNERKPIGLTDADMSLIRSILISVVSNTPLDLSEEAAAHVGRLIHRLSRVTND